MAPPGFTPKPAPGDMIEGLELRSAADFGLVGPPGSHSAKGIQAPAIPKTLPEGPNTRI